MNVERGEGDNSKPKVSKPEEIELPPPDVSMVIEAVAKSKMGSVHGEDLPFVFGAPLVDGFGHFPRNYTRPEVALSESIVQYFANFVRTG
ncbi:NLGN2 [Anthophora retusa]